MSCRKWRHNEAIIAYHHDQVDFLVDLVHERETSSLQVLLEPVCGIVTQWHDGVDIFSAGSLIRDATEIFEVLCVADPDVVHARFLSPLLQV